MKDERLAPENVTSSQEHARTALRKAMQSMFGFATFAWLGDVFESARRDFGFPGSLQDALRLLSSMPDVTVETAIPLDRSRVFGGHRTPSRPQE